MRTLATGTSAMSSSRSTKAASCTRPMTADWIRARSGSSVAGRSVDSATMACALLLDEWTEPLEPYPLNQRSTLATSLSKLAAKAPGALITDCTKAPRSAANVVSGLRKLMAKA
ncbi:hypothetical protein D3C76_1119050 [compost metagenome]